MQLNISNNNLRRPLNFINDPPWPLTYWIMINRLTVRCLHRRLTCMIKRRAAIGSTLRFSTNQNEDM